MKHEIVKPTMMRRHRPAVESELLPHHVVELILERLPVKPLLRFKCVSNKWKSTIESPTFEKQHLIRRRLSRDLDVLFMPVLEEASAPQRFVFGSSIAHTDRLPTSTCNAMCRGSCDGLVCLYNIFKAGTNAMVNPATGWKKTFPISHIHQLLADMAATRNYGRLLPFLGFGKDNVRGTYKPVCLYNSFEFGLDNATTCEVFDFSTNAWSYLLPSSPCRILKFQEPLHFNGFLYWLTEGEETKVLSFNLHTETFQVIVKAPLPRAPDPHNVTMCILDDHLCVSLKNWPTQVIWSLDSSSNSWKELCCIDLTKTFEWFGGREPDYVLFPIAILDKNKLLLKGRDYVEAAVVHDLDTNSCDLLFQPTSPLAPVCYFESFLSIL